MTKEDLAQIKELFKENNETLLAQVDERLDRRFKENNETLLAQVNERFKENNKDIINQVNVLLENTVLPQLRLLAEGHQLLQETLAPKDKVEALEDEVQYLKAELFDLRRELEEVKKAI